MSVIARYTRSDGAGCVRTIATASEAEKILKGGYRAKAVTLELDGELVGERVHKSDCGFVFEDRRHQWFWWYDPEVFKA